MKMASLKEKVGATIVRLREERDIDQWELARDAGLSPNSLSKIENGKTATNLDILEAIAKTLGVTPATLLMTDADRPSIKDSLRLARQFLQEAEMGANSPSPLIDALIAERMSQKKKE
jgi:transcriptional regulator with XRE-family HTH domain